MELCVLHTSFVCQVFGRFLPWRGRPLCTISVQLSSPSCVLKLSFKKKFQVAKLTAYSKCNSSQTANGFLARVFCRLQPSLCVWELCGWGLTPLTRRPTETGALREFWLVRSDDRGHWDHPATDVLGETQDRPPRVRSPELCTPGGRGALYRGFLT